MIKIQNFLFLLLVQRAYLTTVILTPSIIHAKYWQTISQETSASPVNCVLKCEEEGCPGVAFERDRNICRFGFAQSTPDSTAIDKFLEIWKVKPLVDYEPASTSTLKYLCKNDCSLYAQWTKESNGKRYQFNPQIMTKAEHETLCREQGAHLAKITTKLDEEIVSSLIGDNETWIGLTNVYNQLCFDATCDNHLVWSDGTMFLYDPFIYSKHINSGSGHSCLRIKGPEYNDNNCLALFAGICEVTCD